MPSLTRARRLTAASLLFAAGCAPASAPVPAPAAAAASTGRRVIVVSFDSFNEARFRAVAGPDAAPALHAFLGQAACAEGARPAFPSKTAPGHASLWTGSYGNVDGITVNWQALLPIDQHTLLEQGSGFAASALRAEPLWVTAGLAGLRVAGSQATQTPDAPGYPPRTSTGDPRLTLLDSLRARGGVAVAQPQLALLNGYNRTLSEERVVTERTAPVRPATGWRNLALLGGDTLGLREMAGPLGGGGDSLFLLFPRTGTGVDRAIAAGSRDVAAGAGMRPSPTDSSWPAGRPLARHFSAPVVLTVKGTALPISLRLFELAPDLSRLLLFVPALQPVDANVAAPTLGAEYARAIGGWVGNSTARLYAGGAFGPRRDQGGTGEAELRWMETAEYLVRQEMRGTEWLWRRHDPQLLLDYSPLIDDVDHVLFGLVSAGVPGHDARVAAALEAVRRRAYALVDRRFAALRTLAERWGALLFLASDHGMRATWRGVRPNVALAAAGLLAVDSGGKVDLAHTRAFSPDGYFVVVNTTAHRGGIVAPAEVPAVVNAAERALLAARGADGDAVFTRTWRAAPDDTLGIGGPTGGDLYYEVAPGYVPDGGTGGPLTREARPSGNHGFPSVAPDMQAILCVVGPRLSPRRLGPVRTIDLAPTVLDYFGIVPPPTMQGRSLLGQLLRP
ncbi:MAG: alkaline phosphatase family protein [Gemmatimonadaceae bacterium]